MATQEAKTCLRCGSEFKKDQQYCTYCGSPVVNRCCDPGTILRDPCTNVCDSHDLFCPKCGSKTAFYKAGILSAPYEENKVLEEDEFAEMDFFHHKFFLD